MECWREVKGFEGLYFVSDYGRVRSQKKILSPKKEKNGYLRVTLYKTRKAKTVSVHRLVAEAFLGPCSGNMQINHKDGCKVNNHVSNLEYCTCSENIKHAYDAGLKERCREHGREMAMKNMGKLTAYRDRVKRPVISIDLRTNERIEHESVNMAARNTNTDPANVSRVLNGTYRQTRGYLFKYKED